VVDLFYESGGRVIDSSPMYGKSESTIGALLAPRQADYFLATKVWTRGEKEGLAQIEESFRKLHAHKIDLLQIHNLVDWRTHLKTLRALKEAGRIRYIGVTHYSVAAFEELLLAMTDRAVDFVQLPYSVFTRAAEESLLGRAAERAIAVVVNRPFEEGALLRRLRTRQLPSVARELGCFSWAELLLKFILARPEVTCVIPATSNPEHMREILRAGTGRLPNDRERELIFQAARE
jgi:diketogulonate reductase-like aldo/keto reductase